MRAGRIRCTHCLYSVRSAVRCYCDPLFCGVCYCFGRRIVLEVFPAFFRRSIMRKNYSFRECTKLGPNRVVVVAKDQHPSTTNAIRESIETANGESIEQKAY